MKILVIHNFHRKGSASGDDQVYKEETRLLEEHGDKVIRYDVSNDEFDSASFFKKIILTFGMLWSFKNYKAVSSLIKAEMPDIVHIHTFFPLLSSSIFYAAKRCNIPVVATLHDTRLVCPCATSLRDNKLCNACGDGHYLKMCKYRCFKGSYLQSLFVALIFKYHRLRRSFYDQIDKYICLNDSQIQLLEKIGFDKNKITKKYNFVPEIDVNEEMVKELPERYVVFYGRIGEEKGIRALMQIWDNPLIDKIPLVIMGSGPLEEEFRRWADNKYNVYYLGYTQRDKCLGIVKNSEFVVFPSIWYEGCSMVVIEAESLGKALIATDIGFASEAIKDGINGYKASLNDVNGFVHAIKNLWEQPEKCSELGLNARQEYKAKYVPEDNYKQLMSIYRSLM